MYMGTFYPCSSTTYYGYLTYNYFYDLTSDFDFDVLPEGSMPYCWTQEKGYVAVPSQGKLGFMSNNMVYQSRKQAEKAMEATLKKSAYLPELLTVSTVSKISKICSECTARTSSCHTVLSKVLCYPCLKRHLVSEQLYSDLKDERVYWSAQIIYAAYSLLSTESPEGLPSVCPLPYDTIICVGKRKEEAEGYPSYGHLIGKGSQCMEEGCREHILCKDCANSLLNCPFCHRYIGFELIPKNCITCNELLCYDFNTPCRNCHQKPSRRKPKQN